ncbi:MAG: IS1595 family transposase [Actinomycetota bacterium]|nr:IS1595 family transposase [Actinomycetota bacterium]
MAKTDRNNPKRASSSESTYSRRDFDQDFPDDAAALEWLVGYLYPDGIFCAKCGKITKHHRLRSRPAWACQFCGSHEYPMRGTIFEGSSTSLRLWFEAIYLMSQTRCGISAKQLERELGVSYPTAHRMFKKIRSMLGQDDDQLSGEVEMDETYYGGKPRLADRERKPDGSLKRGRTAHSSRKQMVFGAVERGGRIRAEVVPKDERGGIARRVGEYVMPSSVIYTDEYVGYDKPGQAFTEHHRIRHAARIYVDGDVHTNTIEGFWALLKGGIGGVYHSVSSEYLQAYVDEYVFRYNHRESQGGMFSAFLGRIVKTVPETSV